jgi:protein SCO1/2
MIPKVINSGLLSLGLILVSTIEPAHGTAPAESESNRDVRFEQRIGARIPLDAPFVNDQGQNIDLKQLFRGRPVVLAMGYYQCPMLCGVVLNALVETLQQLPSLLPARDYDFVFISVDPAESSDLAAAKKRTYLKRYGSAKDGTGWTFLTGTGESIGRVAKEIGFHYRYDTVTRQWVHPSGLVFVTPDGSVSSYLLGVTYPARSFGIALQQAAEKKPGSPVEQILLLCFSYNPASGTVGSIVITALRVGSVMSLIGLLLLIWFSTRSKSKRGAPNAH